MTGRRTDEGALERLRDAMERTTTRVVLSGLILLSLLPLPFVQDLRFVFFGIFATEVGLRGLLLLVGRPGSAWRRPRWSEAGLLLLDILATLSFLDWSAFGDARFLRLFRLSRLLLLAGYWRGFLRDLWTITWQRERRHQLGFVAAVVLVSTLTSAVLLHGVFRAPHDFDGDGRIWVGETDETGAPTDGATLRDPDDTAFRTQLWWAFRQVQDPGNLVAQPESLPLLAVSLTLTIGGLLVFSFLVGVGTTVVDELVVLSRQRRLGLRRHVVVVGGGCHARFLLEELAGFQAKGALRSPVVSFGSTPERPAELRQPELSFMHYRHGDPARPDDLLRADVDQASLVIVLADEEGGDALTVSRILAVRQLNTQCRIVADVQRAQNLRSVREAGGEGTAAVATRRFVGLFLAAELVFPGLDALLRELLTASGQELYLADCRGRGRIPRFDRFDRFDRFVARAVRERGVVPLGLRTTTATGSSDVLNPPPEQGFDSVEELLVLAGSQLTASRFGEAVAAGEFEGPADEQPPAPPALIPSPELDRLRRLLVCGYREETGDLLAELGQFLERLEVRLMVAPGRRDEVVRDLAARPAHESGAEWRVRDPSLVELERDGAVRVSVRVFTGDPASDRALRRNEQADHDLSVTDTVLFVADGSWGSDPDAKSALGVLKLLGMLRDAESELRPGLRVVGEIQEAGKGELLEHRLRSLRRELAGARGGSDRSAILSTETLRHFLLGQEVLVPGVADLHAELLRATGDELIKLVPPETGPGADWDFGLLAEALAAERLIPLAVELAGPDGPEAFVNPAPGAKGHRFGPDELSGVFCIADLERLRARGGVGPGS